MTYESFGLFFSFSLSFLLVIRPKSVECFIFSCVLFTYHCYRLAISIHWLIKISISSAIDPMMKLDWRRRRQEKGKEKEREREKKQTTRYVRTDEKMIISLYLFFLFLYPYWIDTRKNDNVRITFGRLILNVCACIYIYVYTFVSSNCPSSGRCACVYLFHQIFR